MIGYSYPLTQQQQVIYTLNSYLHELIPAVNELFLQKYESEAGKLEEGEIFHPSAELIQLQTFLQALHAIASNPNQNLFLHCSETFAAMFSNPYVSPHLKEHLQTTVNFITLNFNFFPNASLQQNATQNTTVTQQQIVLENPTSNTTPDLDSDFIENPLVQMQILQAYEEEKMMAMFGSTHLDDKQDAPLQMTQSARTQDNRTGGRKKRDFEETMRMEHSDLSPALSRFGIHSPKNERRAETSSDDQDLSCTPINLSPRRSRQP